MQGKTGTGTYQKGAGTLVIHVPMSHRGVRFPLWVVRSVSRLPSSPQGVKGLPPESSYRIKNTGGSWDTHGTGTGHVPAGVGGSS